MKEAQRMALEMLKNTGIKEDEIKAEVKRIYKAWDNPTIIATEVAETFIKNTL